MEREKTLKIVDSWTITGLGIIVEIMHLENGLPNDTLLTSLRTGYKYKIKGRIIFNHTSGKQKRFEGETENPMHLTIRPVENYEKSVAQILEKECQNIYQYLIIPIENNEKPKPGDLLEIKNKNLD